MTEDTETNYHLERRGSSNINSYKSSRRISFLDLFTYLFCTASLVISIYTYYYQLSAQSKALSRASYVDGQLQALASQVKYLLRQEASATGSDGTWIVKDEFPDVANVVKKVALQEFGLERLKRDISHLKRREGRQASLQQSPECICPAGN